MKITCFLPCRKGSERVKQKNIKPFNGIKGGLLAIKLQQLSKVDGIDNILLSTNDEEIIEFAKNQNIAKLKIHHRSEELSSSQASTDSVIKLAGELITDGHILWTHVTSPFLNAEAYNKIIETYKKSLNDGHDSLMTVSVLHSFIWNKEGPINYDLNKEKWPRTQTLEPLYEINSGVFLCDSSIYRDSHNRIGNKPYLFPLDKIQGFDIDWPEDFELAELMLKSGSAKI